MIPPKRQFDFSSRCSGILFHITSLQGDLGSGDLGPEAHKFIDLLKHSGQSWWQMLPVGPPGRSPSFSPYDSPSCFAGNPMLVSPLLLHKEKLLESSDVQTGINFSSARLNFAKVNEYRRKILKRAFINFCREKGDKKQDFKDFCESNHFWLEDFSLFMALKEKNEGRAWCEWHDEIKNREPVALRDAAFVLKDEISFNRFIQFKFDKQWQGLRSRSGRCGVGLIGDIPIFVAYDSADVWCNRKLFMLDTAGKPLRISGYPPDRFNPKGQRWGHPQYNWKEHQSSLFEWWISRFSRMYDLFDAVRIDHFLGFSRTWSIPSGAMDATKGKWVKSPGRELFTAVFNKLGPKPVIAEDLGHVTPADIKLRQKFRMLPMKVFQFGFGNDPDAADHLPHTYSSDCAAYTGTHDNDTLTGWFNDLPAAKKRRVLMYTGGEPSTIHLDCIRVLMASKANIVIFPVQDILGLGKHSRMNIPGTLTGNWDWRLQGQIPSETVKNICLLTELYGRKK